MTLAPLPDWVKCSAFTNHPLRQFYLEPEEHRQLWRVHIVKALVTLTPAESKRLIAKAVAKMGEVKNALRKGIVIISLGTTNAYVAEEILGKKLDKALFAAGIVTPKGTCITPRNERLESIIIKRGKTTKLRLSEALDQLGPEDVFIKGANALDPEGHAGVFTADPYGGTVGKALGVVMARGVHYIIPVGLEKFIPISLVEVSRKVGVTRIDKSMGAPVGLTVVTGRVVTEVDALRMLTGVKAIPMGAGGIGGAEGTITLLLDGEGEYVEEAWNLIKQVKGEKPLLAITEKCSKCTYNCIYRSEG